MATLEELVQHPESVDVPRGHLKIVPYNGALDPEAHAFLPWLWKRLVDDGLVSIYFPGQEETGFSNFVKLISGGEEVVLVVVRDEEDKLSTDIVGFCSWNPIYLGQVNTVLAGFIFFKKFWDKKITDESAHLIMQHWFEKREDIDIALGIVARKNIPTLRFLKRVGWTQSGTIPNMSQFSGEVCDAVMWYKTKEEHLRGK